MILDAYKTEVPYRGPYILAEMGQVCSGPGN